jgi:selenide,water dikinase
MAAASRRCLEIEASAVPLVEDALELAREGLLSGSAKRTRTHLDARLAIVSDLEEARVGLLLDAETSGGLLIAVPEDRADTLLGALRAENTPAAAVIGRVHEHGDALLRLRA